MLIFTLISDPLSLSQIKALETIGHALQAQYERWQPRARYKQSLDPTSEDVSHITHLYVHRIIFLTETKTVSTAIPFIFRL